QRLPGMDGAVHVLLVPQALDPHGRDVGGAGGEQPVERLLLPEAVIGRVLDHPAPGGELVEAVLPRPGAGRSDPAEGLVIVIGALGGTFAPAAIAGLAADPADIGQAEGAVMEPVVAHP